MVSSLAEPKRLRTERGDGGCAAAGESELAAIASHHNVIDLTWLQCDFPKFELRRYSAIPLITKVFRWNDLSAIGQRQHSFVREISVQLSWIEPDYAVS